PPWFQCTSVARILELPRQGESRVDRPAFGLGQSELTPHEIRVLSQKVRPPRFSEIFGGLEHADRIGTIPHGREDTLMVSRRVVRSYQARYSMGANKAAMYDLTDAIDVHAHARGHDEEEPMHAAQEATRAGMKAVLF